MPDMEAKWRTHMDKLAYIVAGVVSLIVVAVPPFSGQVNDPALTDAASDYRVAVKKTKDWVKDQIDETRPPDLRGELAKQWEVGMASRVDPRWVSERAPAFLRKTEAIDRPEPIHKPGVIGEITCDRDAGKKAAYLTIKASMSIENNLVLIKSVTLYRKEGDGKFAPVRGFSAKGDFVYKDYDVKAGGAYTYYFESVAERDPSVAAATVKTLSAEMKSQKSPEIGPTEPVPYDYSLAISQFEAPTPGQSPRFYARFEYWDYESGQYVALKRGNLEIFTEKQRLPDANGRWEITLVNDLDQTVTVKDLEKRGIGSSETFRYKDSRAARPVQCWKEPLLAPALKAAVEGGATEEGAPGETGAQEVPEEAPPAEASAPSEAPTPAQKAASPTKKTTEEKPKEGTDSSKKSKFR